MQPMSGAIQNYAWGSVTAIPETLGFPETGEPQAEYWLGAHASAPSTVGDQNLAELIADRPGIVGEASVREFGPRLPYLLKVLAANRPLSLQAHPSRAQAEEGFARENQAGVALDDPTRSYKDDWPKPELMLALTPFDALCGFRDPKQTVELFEALDIPELDQMVAPLRLRSGSAGLAEVFLDALGQSDERRDLVNAVTAQCVRHVGEEGAFGDFCRTAVLLDEFYPGDSSILGALMMNRFTMQPGEGVYLPAGNLHAYLKGTGIEIMANSDNVLRGGLTPKHIDVDALVSVVDFDAAPVELVRAVDEAPGLLRYPTPAPEFALWQLELTPGIQVELPATETGRTLLVIDGTLRDAEGTELAKGQAAFLPAGEHCVVSGEATAFLAAPGL
ncbi:MULTISPECIES: mannose-6-phosphate isomerase, class I [unclassified Luteococcus]|uniref:mannose-6-phosphate isomerase, class I n=1 Tax=unclassified Luteococcus TaxID=2639923 RepID=UPI00313C30B0